MRFQRYTLAILVILAIIAVVPGLLLAQSSQVQGSPTDPFPDQRPKIQSSPASPPFPNQLPQVQSAPGNPPLPELKGGVATVIGVDQPDNCLRIRSGPGSAYDVIGCAPMGEKLNLTGVWTSNDWAQLTDNNGWVYGPQIATDLRPPQAAFSAPETRIVVEEGYPVYEYGYLPDYGYSTYWYAGIPIIVYAANIWWRHHPWWWKNWAHHHHPWRWNAYQRRYVSPYARGYNPTARGFSPTTRGFNAATRNFSPTTRSFNAATRNFSPTTRSFNSANAANLSRNVVSPYRSSASVNALRSGTAASVARSARTFSAPSGFRAGSVGARGFGGHGGRRR